MELAGALSATADDIQAMAATSPKGRYEVDGHRIRARYGHSLPERIVLPADTPPALLFHGTSPAAAESIRRDGLNPGARQYVHLATEQTAALEVGRRKATSPVLLVVDAAAAHAHGIAFYRGNERVWLSLHVPARFIR